MKFTPLIEIDTKIDASRECYFNKQKQFAVSGNPNKVDLDVRLLNLKKLYYAIKDHETEILNALFQDFHRSKQESLSFEVIKLLNDILHIIKNLKKWTRSQKISDFAPPYIFGKIHVDRISLGSVLVISPFNFPVLLALTPVAYAIAAGNTVILKPSELTSACAKTIEHIVESAGFSDGYIQIVQGGILETTKLLKSGKFDKIFYTGSPAVGSIVAQEAAKSLTPCVLELGGKSPAFVTANLNRSHLETALKRIFFSAFGNSGQICVSPDYMLVHESIFEEVLVICKRLLVEFWPDLNKDTEYTHMIHEAAFKKAEMKLNITKGIKVSAVPLSKTSDSLCIPPTIVYDIDWDDPLMVEENFTAILPIIKFNDLDDTLDKIIKLHDTPLVQYIFSDDKHEINHILSRIRSGDCIIGDTMIHVGIADVPFGGIGQSGYGSHGGKWGFDAFTHERTVLNQPFWMDFILSMRYPPYTNTKTKIVQLATEEKPWFNRYGDDNLISHIPVVSAISSQFSKLLGWGN